MVHDDACELPRSNPDSPTCHVRVTVGASWDNGNAPGGAGNTVRGLTRSSDFTREGLLVESTRQLDAYDTTIVQRMLSKRIVDSGGCWVWSACTDRRSGYGRVYYRGSTVYTHRLIYTLLRGAIPDGLVIDHLCRNRPCFNPDHLEPVTPRENTLRGETLPAHELANTRCPSGHPYDELNTANYGDGRVCKECRRDRDRERYNRSPREVCPSCGRMTGANRWGAMGAHMIPQTSVWCDFRVGEPR